MHENEEQMCDVHPESTETILLFLQLIQDLTALIPTPMPATPHPN